MIELGRRVGRYIFDGNCTRGCKCVIKYAIIMFKLFVRNLDFNVGLNLKNIGATVVEHFA